MYALVGVLFLGTSVHIGSAKRRLAADEMRALSLVDSSKALVNSSLTGSKFTSYTRNCNCQKGECKKGVPRGGITPVPSVLIETGGKELTVPLTGNVPVSRKAFVINSTQATMSGFMKGLGGLKLSPSTFDACHPQKIKISKIKPVGHMIWPGIRCPVWPGTVNKDAIGQPLKLISKLYDVPKGLGWLRVPSELSIYLQTGLGEQIFCLKVITEPA
jgi:hypothetical protein